MLALQNPIPIIFEDDYLIVLHKPSGTDSQTLPALIKQQQSLTSKELFLINRLDQRVSGLLILAKNKQTAQLLSKNFADKTITKKYRAVVANKPINEEGLLTHWLLKSGVSKKNKAFKTEVKYSQKAELTYQLIASSLKYHLLQINLVTGRFQQIRAQLAAINCPIVGDVKYGYKRTTANGSIFLQSYYLCLNHPITNALLQIEIDMPVEWKKYGF